MGGIIIGSAAVEAGLVSPAVVIVSALTGICSFVIPNISIVSEQRRRTEKIQQEHCLQLPEGYFSVLRKHHAPPPFRARPSGFANIGLRFILESGRRSMLSSQSVSSLTEEEQNG